MNKKYNCMFKITFSEQCIQDRDTCVCVRKRRRQGKELLDRCTRYHELHTHVHSTIALQLMHKI